ncbi:MAG: DUF4112 domain-containing protein [Nitrospiraceae bacterium]
MNGQDTSGTWERGSDPRADRKAEVEREALRQAADLLARVLDAAVPIPGTTWRIGLDPIIGLVPGLGDALASTVGSAILLFAARLRVPRIVLVRMSLNMFLNGTVGAIPVLGDLFSLWFRSNQRNAELLRRHAAPGGSATTGDWLFVIGLATTTLLITLALIAALVWATAALWQAVTGR